ncbi:MAG: hypothetical protein KA210_00760 [Bacteroidia bacterium]|nr:hypothetical protein [Bacteroidia bacterium]
MKQKEAFLFYLQRMDIDMLDIVLSDTITYFGVNKTDFLKRLDYIINELKSSGEKTPLNIYQKEEFSTTYYLTSTIFDFEQEFIIEEKEGCISDISSSLKLKTNEEIDELHCLELFFGIDERIDFKPTTDYVLKLHKCINAFEEIVNDTIQIVDYYKICYWIKKHKSLYKEIKNDTLMFRFNDFRNLFKRLKYFKKHLKHSSSSAKAIRAFDDKNYNSIQKWKDDFNRLFFCRLQSFEVGLIKIVGMKNSLKINNYPNVIFKGTDFFSIIDFNELYLKHINIQQLLLDNDQLPF